MFQTTIPVQLSNFLSSCVQAYSKVRVNWLVRTGLGIFTGGGVGGRIIGPTGKTGTPEGMQGGSGGGGIYTGGLTIGIQGYGGFTIGGLTTGGGIIGVTQIGGVSITGGQITGGLTSGGQLMSGKTHYGGQIEEGKSTLIWELTGDPSLQSLSHLKLGGF